MGAEKRKAKRHPVTQRGMIYGPDGKAIAQCEMQNVSVGGAQLALEREMPLPRNFVVALSHDGAVRRRCTVAWEFATVVGVRFVETVER